MRCYFLWQRQQRYLWLAIGNPTRQCGPCTRGVVQGTPREVMYEMQYPWPLIDAYRTDIHTMWKKNPQQTGIGITIRFSQCQRIQPELKQKARAPWFDEASAAWLQKIEVVMGRNCEKWHRARKQLGGHRTLVFSFQMRRIHECPLFFFFNVFFSFSILHFFSFFGEVTFNSIMIARFWGWSQILRQRCWWKQMCDWEWCNHWQSIASQFLSLAGTCIQRDLIKDDSADDWLESLGNKQFGKQQHPALPEIAGCSRWSQGFFDALLRGSDYGDKVCTRKAPEWKQHICDSMEWYYYGYDCISIHLISVNFMNDQTGEGNCNARVSDLFNLILSIKSLAIKPHILKQVPRLPKESTTCAKLWPVWPRFTVAVWIRKKGLCCGSDGVPCTITFTRNSRGIPSLKLT